MTKTKSNKKQPLNVILTSLSFKEIKKSFGESEKASYIDISKIISDNFGVVDEMSDIQYWILNQMLIKKIEGFRASKSEKIIITIKEPNKNSVKSFKELLKDNKISPVQVEIHLP